MADPKVIPPPPDHIPPPPDAGKPTTPIQGFDWSNPETYKDPAAQVALKEQSRLGGVLAGTEKPKGFSEAALQGVGAIPLMAAGGALGAAAKVGPVVGRMATEVGLSKLRGNDWLETAINAAGAGVGDAGAKVASKVSGHFAEPAQALEWIRERVGKGPDGAVNLEHVNRLIEWWRRAPTKAAMEAAGEQVVTNLKESFGPEVSRMFRRSILRAAVHAPGVPSIRTGMSLGASQAARAAELATQGDPLRATVDAFLGTPPFSAFAVGALGGAAKPIARHVPGGREVIETIEEAAE